MERTYVFNSDGNSGGARYDINAMLPGLMSRGIDPGVLALMNNGGGFGGQNGIWGVIYLAIVASIFGWNNGGFGGFGGRGGNGLPAELAGNAGRELLMQAIQGNASAINQIASTLNCSSQQIESALCNIQNSVGLTGTQIINATILNAVGQQIAPLAAGLQALQGDVEKVKCSLPPTISVPYPTVTAVNTDLYKAAAYGAAAGNYAGCGCGYNAGFWG